MYDDYLKLLRCIYDEKKKAGTLSGRLMNPTPGNLKKECINALNHRFEKKDEKALRDFFEQFGDNIVWERAIRKFETSRFKPLGSYLREETNSTHEFNIEILAWLLGIKDRPYNSTIDYAKDIRLGSEENTGNSLNGFVYKNGISGNEFGSDLGNTSINDDKVSGGYPEGKEKKEPEYEFDESGSSSVSEEDSAKEPLKPIVVIPIAPVSSPEIMQPEKESRIRKIWKSIPISGRKIAAVMLPVAIGTSMYLGLGNKQLAGGCMYWNVDHYQEISCHPATGDTLVVALDSLKLKNFRKINDLNTITYGSIGKVWYSKSNNSCDFFTAGGYHPNDRNRKLRPITIHIIDKYVIPFQTGKVFN